MPLRDESDEGAEPTEGIRPGVVTAVLARIAGCPTVDRDAPLAPGARLGRYEIIRPVGHGAFGTVYEAHDAELHRLVALKVLHASRAGRPEDATEGEAAARLAHPNVAALHDAGVLDGGVPYLVYEFLQGETLESRLERGPLRPREALDVAIAIARALVHAHAHGVVHRDLKPANVFLTAEGEVKVLDFGVALLFGRAGPSGGTPAYMAPEQRRGEPEDARTDLFALGLVLAEMLTGERGAAVASPAERIPRGVRPVLASLLAEDPTARPRNARLAVTALEAVQRATGDARGGSRKRARAALAALAVLGALGAALLLRVRPPRQPADVLPSVAVLPFADMSPQKDQEYFSDGLAEEILNALAQLDGLHVAGRTSSFSFKGRTDDVATIAAKLHVTSLLEGSVRKAGNRVRITAQLVDAASGYHLWSQTYDRELTDVFAAQDDIARAVVAALKVKLFPGALPSTRAYRTANGEAYDAYLAGRDLRRNPSPERLANAAVVLERALSLDPAYAPAWTELAYARYYHANMLTRGAEVDAGKRRAADAAERAVALDPGLAEAYAARATVRQGEWRWTEALADLDRAVALNAGSADVHLVRSQLLFALGRLDAADAELRRAAEIDPLWALVFGLQAEIRMTRGDPAGARELISHALELSPDAFIARHQMIRALLLEGRPAEAAQLLERLPERPWRSMEAALVWHALGDAARARRALEALVAEAAQAAAFQIAEVHAFWGEHDRAFAWLDRAVAQHDDGLVELRTSPFLRVLSGDPRFGALLRRVNLPAD